MNIPVSERTKDLLGIVTQDGLFRAERMMFGLVGAPMYFQYMMDVLRGRSTVPNFSMESFFDDSTTHGSDW